MSEKCYYKIVRKETDNKYYSMNYAIAEDLQIEYKIGEEAKAKIGKIFIFRTLKATKEYIRYAPSNMKILKVRVKNVSELNICTEWVSSDSDIRDFWSDYYSNSNTIENAVYAPEGTMGAESVIPIEFVGR